MGKHFQFEFLESQKEGEATFDDVEYPYEKQISSRVSFESSTRWDNILLEFASFLDATGYIGVHDKVSKLLADYWEPVYNFDVSEDKDENPDCAGLSD